LTRILIAEDDPRIAALLEKGLRSNGFSTLVADDGAQAEQLALTDQFDLLILDMGLPVKDGLHVLQDVRAKKRTLPVIVLTGRADRDAAMCLDAGADDYMRKPFRFDELLARVRARLRAGAHEPGVAAPDNGG
jgi:DNA-binding response OmpR family regulator